MRLIFFAVLALVFFAPLGSGQPVSAIRSIVLTSFVLLLMGVTAEIPSSYLVHRIWREPEARFELARLFRRLRRLHLACAVGMYFSTLIFFDWPTLVRVNWGMERTVVLDEVLILFPFVLGLLASWSSFYRVERAFHLTSDWGALEPFPSGYAFVSQQARQYLALLLEPFLVFTAVQGGLQASAAGWPWIWLILYGLACLLFIVLLLPWLWIKAWPTATLPSGSRRDLLISASQKVGVTCTNYLLLFTNGTQALAMLVGYLPWPRFLIFSDVLLENLPDEELEAILAHELGHVRCHHLVTQLLYVSLSVLFWTWLGMLVIRYAGALTFWDQLGFQFLLMFALGFYLRVTLGALSRRLEREADLMGCLAWHQNAASYGLSIFAGALHRVAQLNGQSPDQPSWLHGSVGERTRALQELLLDPFALTRFRRRMMLIKTGLVAGVLTLGIWTMWYWYGW
jgi:STE24 endopeptidase